MKPADILLTDQTALVTGGAGGIGRGVALGLAEFGADVVILDIDEEQGEQTASDVRSAGRRALAIKADVTDPDQVRSAVDRSAAEFGRLDILINNVGGSRPGPFIELSDRSIRRHLDLNLTGLFTITAAVAKVMIAAGRGGSIVNVASIEGLRAAPAFGVYAACKAAMVNLTRTLALELAEHQIRVNVIAPDIVITPGMERISPRLMSDEQVAGRKRYIPLGRDGEPDDCAGAAVFLCSKLASYVTGAVLSVDGGTFASSGWTRAGAGWTPIPGVEDLLEIS